MHVGDRSVMRSDDIVLHLHGLKHDEHIALLDCGTGGTGRSFDWSCLEEAKQPYFLAGGIGIHNMKEAVERFHPFAVDLSSSVETDGVKDEKKIADAVHMLRSMT